MDFVGMFAQMAETPEFAKKVKEKFGAFCELKQIPQGYRLNHAVTWEVASKQGAVILAEIVGEMLEKHPYMAKQVMKMVGVDDGK